MLRISESTYADMIEHGKREYPHEAIGVLLGKGSSEKDVVKVRTATNVNKERAADRYDLDPGELHKIDKEARAEGLDVLGFYHSHPDHPSAPSQFDRDRGFPSYSYIITAIHKGEEESTRCWTFEDMDAPFEEEEMVKY